MALPLRSPHFNSFSASEKSGGKRDASRSPGPSYTISHRPVRSNSVVLTNPQQPVFVPQRPSERLSSNYRTEIPKRNPIVSAYLALSWSIGYREKYTLLWMFIFGGALLGFCLARSPLLNPTKMREMTVAGEFLWFEIPLYKYNYIIHIYLSIFGGILSGLQFVPMIRRRYILLHRINGYIVFTTLFIANITGGIVARRSFGGELNSQSVYYITGLMSNLSFLWALVNVKRNTRIHRKWMLRGVVYFSVVISGKIIGAAAQAIITDMRSFYSIWRCDEVLFVLRDLEALLQAFPECTASDGSLTNPYFYVAVHASTDEGKLGGASAARATQGMVLWIATLIHVIGIEIYLRTTDEANYKVHSYALEPRDFDPDHDSFVVHY